MKNKMIVLIVIVAAVIVAGAAFAFTYYSPTSSVPGSGTQSSFPAPGFENIEEAVVAPEGEPSEVGYSGQVIAGSTTPYVRYNEADFQKARSEGKAVYLYFYATWCPICAAERPNILTAFDQLDLDNAVGFEAHWNDGQNTEADNNLARAYGVGSQHTHIFIDKNGNVVEKTLAGLSSNDIKMHLTAAAEA